MPSVVLSDFTGPKVRQRVSVPLPECGLDAYVLIEELTVKEIRALRAAHGREADTDNLSTTYGFLHAACLNESGGKMFESPAQAEETFNLPMPVLERIIKAILTMSGIEFTEKN